MYAIEVVKSSSDNNLTPGFAAIMCLWGTDSNTCLLARYTCACYAFGTLIYTSLAICLRYMRAIRCISYDNHLKIT